MLYLWHPDLTVPTTASLLFEKSDMVFITDPDTAACDPFAEIPTADDEAAMYVNR